MRSASSFRRSAGLVAAATVAFSTTVLLGPGTAQAAASWTATASGVQAPIPAGICAVRWTVYGGGAGLDSDGTPGWTAGSVSADVPAEAGDVYTLVLGGSGTDADPNTLTPGVGGTRPDNDATLEGEDGAADSSVAGGGGGAASTVELDGSVILQARGGDAYGDVGGLGGGENFSIVADWFESDVDITGMPAEITGEGMPCMPAIPNLMWAEGLDSAVRLTFSDGYDPVYGNGDVPTTGYEYTKDGGATWAALTGVTEADGLLNATIGSLTNGTTYAVSLRAIGGADTEPSAASTEFDVTPHKKATAPTDVTVTTGEGTLTVSWGASTAGTYPITGYGVSLVWGGDNHGGGAPFCQTGPTVFTCTAPAQPGVTHRVQVHAVTGELQGESVEVTSGVVPASRTVPEADGAMTLPAGAKASVAAGKTITLSGSGYLPNSTVTLLIYSEPQILTTVVTDATGSFTVTVTVPAGLAVGQHTLVAAGLAPDGTMRYVTLPVTVTAAGAQLANTGVDVTAPALGGLAAVVVGAGLLVAARRRPEPVAATPGTGLAD